MAKKRLERMYLKKLRLDNGYTKITEMFSKDSEYYQFYFNLEKGYITDIDRLIDIFLLLSKMYSVSIYDLMCFETDHQLAVKAMSESDTNSGVDASDTFSAALLNQLKIHDIRQTKLAAELGVSRQHIHKITSGKFIPDENVIKKICNFLQLPENYFDSFIVNSKIMNKKR